ncbi:MAG TPA: universal stress protein [Dongiaceae bacterium]|jgi:nucleotide-binding universal stress UspA family protein|nr:universal stress protein [Dongiaceae bacterium]
MTEQKILCATDGAPHSEKAVVHAVGWAFQLQQPITFITVVDGSEIKFVTWDEAKIAGGSLPVDAPLIAALERARGTGLSHVGCVRGIGPRIAETIVAYAEKNSYHHIIMGSAGRQGAARFIKGSVAQELVTLAHCPVTIVR